MWSTSYTEEGLLANVFKTDYNSLVEYLDCFQYVGTRCRCQARAAAHYVHT